LKKCMSSLYDEDMLKGLIDEQAVKTWMKMQESLAEQDYEKWLSQAQELRGLIMERYQMEKARLEELERQIEAISNLQRSIKLDLQELAGGRTGADVTADIQDVMGSMLEAIKGEDIDEAISNAEEMRSLILERYEIEKKKIEETYKTQIEAMEKIKDAYQSLHSKVSDQILSITTSGASQKDIYERIEVQKGEVERLRELAAGAEGAERAGYLSQLSTALGDYLTMAEEGYSRPSLEYGNIYEEVVAELRAIQEEAATQVSYAEGEVIRLGTEMNDKLEALKNDTVTQLQWLNDIMGGVKSGLETEREAVLLKIEELKGYLDELEGITGDIITELGIQKDAAIEDMKAYWNEKLETLGGIEAQNRDWNRDSAIYLGRLVGMYRVGGIPGSPGSPGGNRGIVRHHDLQGTFTVPYTGYTAELKAGEKIVGGGGDSININLGGITVNANDGKIDIRKVERQFIHEIKWGNIGKAIKDTTRKVA